VGEVSKATIFPFTKVGLRARANNFSTGWGGSKSGTSHPRSGFPANCPACPTGLAIEWKLVVRRALPARKEGLWRIPVGRTVSIAGKALV
jgi:hypothetical protein